MGIARSGIGWMIARLSALAVSWLASLYFARALANPQETLGTYYAFETVVSFLVLLANGGLNAAIIKRVSEGEEPEAFTTAGLVLSGIFLFAVSLTAILATPWLIDFFGYGGVSVLLIIGSVIAYQIKDTLGAVLTSNFQLGRSGVVDFVDATGQVSTQVALVISGFGVLALMTGYLLGSILAAVVAVGIIANNLRLKKPAKRHFQSLIQYAKYSFLNEFVQKFYDNIDIIIITALLGKAATGVYGIGFRFSLLLTVVFSAINRTSNPEISKQSKAGNHERIKELLSDAIVLSLLIGLPAVAGFVVLARPIIVTFYTGEFATATIVAVWAVATRIPEGLRSNFGSVLGGMDRPDVVFRGGVLLMITNAVLDIVLIPRIGVVGAVIASFVGMSFQFFYMSYHVIQILDLRPANFPLRDIVLEVTAAIIMASTVFAARTIVGPSSTVTLFGLVALGIVVYFSFILILSSGVRQRLLGILGDMLE